MRKERIRQTDFAEKDRPLTRAKQFGDIFKHRFLEFLKISLLQAIFNMPLIVSLVLYYSLIKNASNVNSVMTIFLIQGASFLISFPSAFIGMTGTYYCVKKIAYAEGEFASTSFFIGLHNEWKKGLIIGLLAGFSAAVALIGYFFLYAYMSQIDAVVTGFGYAILAIQLLVVLIVSYYSIGQSLLYDNKMRFTLKNSFIMTLIRFPLNLGIFIIYPGIFIALFVIMEITMFVGIVLLIFFAAFGHLAWMLNVIAACDKIINKEKYPDYYRKGLRNIKQTEEV